MAPGERARGGARRVTLLDYGMGNLRNVERALDAVGIVATRAAHPGDGPVVLPGVGAYAEAVRRLRESGAWDEMQGVIAAGRPVLGICLGMQLLFESSTEHGENPGFGALRGRVVHLTAAGTPPTVPNMGWHRLDGLGGKFVYFAHSFGVADSPDATARIDHGGPWVAAARRDAVSGFQFHPEKSGRDGLQLLHEWAEGAW